MDEADDLVVFTLDERRLALPLSRVERVVHAVEITPLPGAPEIVPGAINVQGRVLPVLDIRARLGLPERPLVLTDQILLARAATRTVGLLADTVEGVISGAENPEIPGSEIVSGLDYVRGVVKRDGALILLLDLDLLLSREEEKALGRAESRREG